MNQLSINGSLVNARQSAPFFKFALILLIIFGSIFLIWFIQRKIKEYKNSESYISKNKSKATTRKDVKQYAEKNNLTKDDEMLLWEICNLTLTPNINYNLKDNIDIQNLFRNAYDLLIKQELSDQKLFNFFCLHYKIECIHSKTHAITSTKFIKDNVIIFYITEDGEQLPLSIIKNTKDGIYLDMPSFIYNSPRKPKPLVRLRFTFRTLDGLKYNFISRIIRYSVSDTEQITMLLQHTDNLDADVQRRYKREFVELPCYYSPVKVIQESKHGNQHIKYAYSNKNYKGKITNISAGGCCINSNLAIKEKQKICILLPSIHISERIVGTIKQTRKLPNGQFAIHIQFIKISLKTMNIIWSIIFKYHI